MRIHVIRSLESITFTFASSKISISYQVSVAWLTGLGKTWSKTPKTGFLAAMPNENRSGIENTQGY